MSTKQATELCELLQKEYEGCQRLIELSAAEHQALVANPVQTLTKSTRDMQQEVKNLRKVQTRRVELLAEMKQQLELPEDSPLQAVVDRLQLGDAETVQHRLFELITISENLYRINQQTIRLIDFSIGITDKQVDIWSDAMTEKGSYNESGENESHSKPTKIIEGKV